MKISIVDGVLYKLFEALCFLFFLHHNRALLSPRVQSSMGSVRALPHVYPTQGDSAKKLHRWMSEGYGDGFRV
jgi:hypothetical protein